MIWQKPLVTFSLQEFPDDGSAILHFFEPLGRRGSQAHRSKGRFHNVGGTQVDPRLAGKLIERHQSFPIILQPFDGFRRQGLIPRRELVPQRLARRTSGCPPRWRVLSPLTCTRARAGGSLDGGLCELAEVRERAGSPPFATVRSPDTRQQ